MITKKLTFVIIILVSIIHLAVFKVGHCSEATDIGSTAVKQAEVQGKEKEAEEARVEEEKARAELEKKEALKREEMAVQKQLEETSPEKRSVLEVEADVYKQKSFVAERKDELITEDANSYKDRVEFKRIQKNIEELLGGENTPGEIIEELDVIKAESKEIQDKIKAIQGLLSTTEKQKTIVIESLKNARADFLSTVPGEKSKIEKEAEEFSDREQGEQLIKLANLRVKHIEEQNYFIETKAERLNERLESSKALL